MEFASGMVSPVLVQLINSVLDTAQHVHDFKNQLKFMGLRLGHIKAILEANQNNKEATCNNEANEQTIENIQLALSEFRNLMYEADDVCTDCLIRREYHSNGRFSNFLPHNFYFCLKTLNKIEDINRRIQATDDILGRYFTLQGGGNSNEDDREQESCDQLSDISKLDEAIFGLEDDVKTIKSWTLSSDYGLCKIGIVGMGGLGKTTIAKIIYNDRVIRSHFEKKIWVSVSQTFRKKVIIWNISKQLGSGNTLNEILSRLKDSSYLIILDDIWHQEQHLKWWTEQFFSPLSESTSKKSCIIITTRDNRVASKIEVSVTHRPKLLNNDHSWLLFSTHAFSSIKKQGLDVKSYEGLGRQIVEKCGGLPLAIKTVGGLLGSTYSNWKWNDIFEGFCEPNFTEENELVMTSLNLSYEALPGHLKQCLLCFSIYPEDHVIRAESLIHWWIGEGLVRAKGRKTAIEMGYEYLSMLVSRCLVEVADRQGHDTGRVYSCKMHDLVRELIIIMANDEKLRRTDDQSEQELIQEARWFYCTSERQAKSLNQSPKLRALLLLSMHKTKLDKSLRSLTSLRVLDLSSNKLDKDSLKNLFSWISVLKRLACLNLSESEYLDNVPDSICKLQNLQFLILTECPNLSKLSPSVSYLKRLIVLNLNVCNSLPYLPRGLGRLTQLQEVYGLKLVHKQNKGSCRLVELQELGNLRVLHIKLSKGSEMTEQECKVLSEHKKLRVLSIDFDTEDLEGTHSLKIINQLSPPSELEELNLRRYPHKTLPVWISPESLPNLLHLRIDEGHIDEIPTGTAYCSLLCLYLSLLPYLKADWDELKKKMPSLCYAEISGCSHVKNFPGDPNSNTRIWRLSQQQSQDLEASTAKSTDETRAALNEDEGVQRMKKGETSEGSIGQRSRSRAEAVQQQSSSILKE